MTEVVEARSLSSLTTIASNPPQYPRNPTHERHEPVVLYIARVPGSKDVFLSPMKPRDKVVSAEDVQSSLYYLHINQADDARLLEPSHSNDARYSSDLSDSETFRRPVEPVHRKPVLPSRPPSYATLAPEPPPHASLPAYSPPRSPIRQTQEPPLSVRSEIPSATNVSVPMLTRKPLPPPRSQLRGRPGSLAVPGTENIRHDTANQRSSGVLLPSPDQGNVTRRSPPTSSLAGLSLENQTAQQLILMQQNMPFPDRSTQDVFKRPSASRQLSQGDSGSTVTLTLIRRDPASGAQWNVAEILDPPIIDVSSIEVSDQRSVKRKRAGAPMYLEISNPAYSKFLHTDGGPSAPAISHGRMSASEATARDSLEMNSGSRTTANKTFQRRLWMEGARSAEAGFGHTKTRSTEIYNSPRRGDGNGPLSRDSQAYLSSEDPVVKHSSFRGYAFMSPWDTRCEFSTGVGGGTLKCTHIVPDGVGAASRVTPAVVSELRFNLPSSAARPASRTPDEDARSKRSSFFSRSRDAHPSSFHHHGLSLSWQHGSENGNQMDLSLGQEHAGGGFGGKQAKLGKLILEDEGLKMMDLLVAANMALWWRAYERVDKK